MIEKDSLKISDSEYYNSSIERLANEPNNLHEYAQKKLSPAELKALFMKTGKLLTEKLNALIDLLDGLNPEGKITENSILGLIKTGIPSVPTLYDLLVTMRDTDGTWVDTISAGGGLTLRELLKKVPPYIKVDDIDGGHKITITGLFDPIVFNVMNGEKGERGASGVYVGSGEMPDDCNVQIDPTGDNTNCDGSTLATLDDVRAVKGYVDTKLSDANITLSKTLLAEYETSLATGSEVTLPDAFNAEKFDYYLIELVSSATGSVDEDIVVGKVLCHAITYQNQSFSEASSWSILGSLPRVCVFSGPDSKGLYYYNNVTVEIFVNGTGTSGGMPTLSISFDYDNINIGSLYLKRIYGINLFGSAIFTLGTT